MSGGTYSSGTGIWTLGSTLGATAPGNTAVLHITAIVGPGGTYTNVTQVHGSDSFDPDSTPDNDVPTEDDFASVTPIVQPKSDLSLDKTVALTSDLDANGILSIGDRVTFTLTLHNLGPNDARTFTSGLPACRLFDLQLERQPGHVRDRRLERRHRQRAVHAHAEHRCDGSRREAHQCLYQLRAGLRVRQFRPGQHAQ